MTKTILFIALLSSLAYSPVLTQFSIAIDARKDSFYMKLTGPADGYVHVPHTDFLPVSGPKPAGESDLSADVWFAWDESYFYMYAEVKDDLVLVNNVTKPQNDCLELKFDPDPSKKAWAGIVNARLSALDSVNAKNLRGVDNLRGVETLPAEGHLPGEAASSANYARRRTTDGYVLEMRLAWDWIRTDGKRVTVDVGRRFGMSGRLSDDYGYPSGRSVQPSSGPDQDSLFLFQQALH